MPGKNEEYIDFQMVGKLPGNVIAPAAPDPYVEKRRQAAEDGRLAVQPFIREALERLVYLMRFSKDEQMVFKCAKMVLDRGWGLAKALPPDDPGAVGNGSSIIDLLAAASRHVSQLESQGGQYMEVPTRSLGQLPETIEVVPETPEDAQFLEFLNRADSDAGPSDISG